MRSLAFVPLLLAGQPALAQQPAPQPAVEDEDLRPASASEIVVIGSRLAGQVDAPQPPVLTLDEADIASYGASSLGELIASVAPQTGSGRGRGGGHPAILFNGQRIANFREMRNIPPEAIRKMEVLPEEVALRFGFPPNQRVINFILKPDFAGKTIDAEYRIPTRGGFSETGFEASMLRFGKSSRFNIDAQLNNGSLLTEAERGVIQDIQALPPLPAGIDPARYRSLIADTSEVVLNANWSGNLGEGPGKGSIGFSGGFTRNDSRSLSGLDTVLLTAPGGAQAVRPLTRRSRSDAFQAGSTLNKPLGAWQLALTLDGSHATGTTLTDRRADPATFATGIDRARVRNLAGTSLATFSGSPFRMPAGEAAATVKAGFAYTGIRSTDTRQTGPTSLNRGDASAGINLALPIASRRERVLSGVGDLSLNLSAGANRLSDFGTLKDWSAGLTWSPAEKLSFQASYLVNEAAPSLGDLGNPTILSFNVPVFDFVRNETALVTVTSGGNPALRREKQRDIKLSASWELPVLKNSNLMVEYFRNRSNDVTAGFPLLTPEIEAAFPGRVLRDASGRLTAIDRRPVTFDETRASRLRWGLNLSGPLGKAQTSGQGGPGGPGRMGGMPGGPPPGGPPPGGMGRGGPGGPGGPGMGRGRFGGGGPMMRMMGGGGGQGRWNLSIYHTYRFDETVRIAPAGPVLDLLDGDALSGGGVARHALEFEGGGFYRGFGLRANGSWAAPTRVDGTGLPGSSDLRFGSVFRLDMRLFVDFDRQEKLVKSVPFLKGSRFAIEVENVFDRRQRVTDSTGRVPLSYQPDYLDPRGRVIEFDFRKMF